MRGLDPRIHLLGKNYGYCEEWMDPRVKPAGDTRDREVKSDQLENAVD